MEKFPEILFVGLKHEPQFIEFPAHETMAHALLGSQTSSNGRARIAEYKLVRVVEAKMVPEIMAEIGQ